MWRPPSSLNGTLPRDLKRVISRRLWGTDGTCGDGEATMDLNDIQYLEGLKDAGISGAQELIDLIKTHGTVILWHEH
jgi:hypothetical protein